MLKFITRTIIPLIVFLPVTVFAMESQDQPKVFNAQDSELEWGPCPDFIPQGCEIAVLNGDPSEANADIFFKLPEGFEVPNHWHTSVERMVLVSGELQVEFDGHDSVSLEPGTYAYGPAKLPHTATCKMGDECVLFIAFEEPVDAHPAE